MPYIGYLLEEKNSSNKYPIYFSLGQMAHASSLALGGGGGASSLPLVGADAALWVILVLE